MNLVEAFLASKDGRIRQQCWDEDAFITFSDRLFLHWETGPDFLIQRDMLTADDWKPYVEAKPETPEEMMRRVAREELRKARVVNALGEILPGDSDD